MRLQGHRLTTAWNGAQDERSQSVGVCLCGEWAAAGRNREELREMYADHLETEAALKAAEVPVEGDSADFRNHHIQGYARAAQERGLDGAFSAPLISEILPGLWMGGCRNGVALDERFDHVVSLYPWEKYTLAESTTRTEIRMYDAGEMPDLDQVTDAAVEVLERRRAGETVLVHCQAGLNRSGLITALSLIFDGYEPQAAIDLLREKRCSMVLCNDTFETWLLSLDAEALAEGEAA